MEKKIFELQIKSTDDATGIIEGYASTFGNVDLGGDVVEKGAFKKTLQERPSIPLLWQHDSDMPIGLISEAKEDDSGLYFTAQLNLEVQKGREAYALLKQQAVKGISIGYQSIKDKIEDNIRKLKEIKLYEISVVTFPMNEMAGVTGIKSMPELDTAIIRLMNESNGRPEIIGKAVEILNSLTDEEPSEADTRKDAEPREDIKSLDFTHLLSELKQINNTLGVN